MADKHNPLSVFINPFYPPPQPDDFIPPPQVHLREVDKQALLDIIKEFSVMPPQPPPRPQPQLFRSVAVEQKKEQELAVLKQKEREREEQKQALLAIVKGLPPPLPPRIAVAASATPPPPQPDIIIHYVKCMIVTNYEADALHLIGLIDTKGNVDLLGGRTSGSPELCMENLLKSVGLNFPAHRYTLDVTDSATGFVTRLYVIFYPNFSPSRQQPFLSREPFSQCFTKFVRLPFSSNQLTNGSELTQVDGNRSLSKNQVVKKCFEHVLKHWGRVINDINATV